MPRRAQIHYTSIHSSLVNLPISLYGPLLERGIRPQGLAVHLTRVSRARSHENNEKLEAYVGWTGMASASSLAQFNTSTLGERGLETIEIDPQYSDGLGFAQGDIVEIGLLHDLAYAKSVATEPVTSDDWELIEIHASHVESTLLSQVRVAVVGQEIDVWVFGKTRVRLTVASLNPATQGKALLLTTSTEVSIAPKLRTKFNPSTTGGRAAGSKEKIKHSKVSGAVNSVDSRYQRLPAKTEDNPAGTRQRHTRKLRSLPSRLFPAIMHQTFSESDKTMAYVSRETLISLSSSNTHSNEWSSWYATIRKIKPPIDPMQDGSSTISDSNPLPRVLVPNGDSTTVSPSSGEVDESSHVVTWSPDVAVPEGHIILHGPGNGVEEFDLVRVTFTREDGKTVDSLGGGADSDAVAAQRSSKTMHGLAGVDEILTQCSTFCLANFASHAFSGRLRGVPGLLVTGRSGAGKTSLLQAVAKSLQEDTRTLAYTLYVDLHNYADTPVAKLKPTLKYWMDKVTWHRPGILILDNIEKLMGAELEHADSFRSRHIAELFGSIFGSSSKAAAPDANGVVLLAAAESQSVLHPSLHTSHIFQEVINLKPPSKDARRDIIGQLVQQRLEHSNITEDPSAPLNLTVLATQTEGYSVTDLKDLVARAVHKAAIRTSKLYSPSNNSVALTPEDFSAAQVDFMPHSLRDVKLQKSEVEWADIGGLRETKRVLRETLEWPTKYGPIFAQSPLRLRSGLLLYGYPGCGKTLLASAVARECGLNFISIKGPELLNKYIGASEKSVRDLFERASAAKPCVLFFDEFDSIAPKRGHDSTGVTDRVVNQMLTQMDGAEGLDGVYVLAATSRPDLIDSALLRPGRLDKSLLCDMPDFDERKEIIEALARKLPLSQSVSVDDLAHRTEGYSGADLQALVYNAHLEVIHDSISPAVNGHGSVTKPNDIVSDATELDNVEYTVLGQPNAPEERTVRSKAEELAFQRRLHKIMAQPDSNGSYGERATTLFTKPNHEIAPHHIEKVFKTTRPSLPAEERERLKKIYSAFVSDRSGELPVPPEGTDVGTRVSLM